MAEPAGDAVRALRFPPTPTWGRTGPSTKTLREDISRWYEPAGGIDKAIAGAREAMQQVDAPFYPWDPRQLDREFPVITERQPVQYQNGSTTPPLGMYHSSTGVISLRPGIDKYRQNTIEHERSHAVFGTHGTGQGMSDQETRFLGSKPTNYITSPDEVDVRLANIKRQYAYNTGRLVDSPEEAERALKWWGRNSDDHQLEAPLPEQTPYAPKSEAGTYLLLPEEQKQKVLRRMPELVNLIERLGQYG